MFTSETTSLTRGSNESFRTACGTIDGGGHDDDRCLDGHTLDNLNDAPASLPSPARRHGAAKEVL